MVPSMELQILGTAGPQTTMLTSTVIHEISNLPASYLIIYFSNAC